MKRRELTRRTFIGLMGTLAIVPLSASAQYELTPEVVPASTPSSTPSTAPEATLDLFQGDIQALWTEPWEVEGKRVQFKCIVVQRLQAGKGSAIRVGVIGDFKSLLRVDIPAVGSLWVASNLTIESIENRKTIAVEGEYGGVFGPGWTEPVLIANRWGAIES